MKTFFLENFGCRATEADAAAVYRDLTSRGLSFCADAALADVVVLNTCTVTAAADSQTRETVRKIHRANPGARIIVTGCYAQRAPDELATLAGVTHVVGNGRQHEIPGLIATVFESSAVRTDRLSADFVPLDALATPALSLAQGPAKILTSDIFERTDVQLAPASLMAGSHTRPILKIQDGCNNRCAYCVIPFVRGRSRSLPPDDVVAEVRKLVEAGAREIVLSGINLGSYGRDLIPRCDLASVVRRILQETSLDQLRFSSIEPQDITEDFVSLVGSSRRLAPHFHVPMQSGSDRILKAMHRWYRTAHYAERIRRIHRLLPNAAIGADVIVGFPGETDQDFQATLGVIESLPFTYLHVFSFSPRPGTEATELGQQVNPSAIHERARALRTLSNQKAAAFRERQQGRSIRALTLARWGDVWTETLTANYVKVRIAGRFPANEWHEIRLPKEGSLAGTTEETSVFENHFGERQVAAVGDGERYMLHAEPVRDLPRGPFQV